MGKQELSLKVVPDNATHKGLVVTLSDKELASLTPTANGVELDARKGGTGTLTVESHHGEVTKTIPVNVQEATDLLVDGKLNTGARYVKDLSAYPNLATKRHFATKTVTVGNGDMTAYWGEYTSSTAYMFNAYYNKANVTFSCDVKVKSKTGTGYIYLRESNGGWKALSDPMYLSSMEVGKTYRLSGTRDFSSTTAPLLSMVVALAGNNGNGTYEVSNLCINLGGIKEYYPAPEDYGIVHGQPNLLDGTSGEWQEFTFSGYEGLSKRYSVGDIFKVNDTISITNEIDNSVGSANAASQILFIKSDGTTAYYTSNVVIIGETKKVTLSRLITEDVVTVVTRILYKSTTGTDSTVKVRNTKVIKGTLDAMDHWTPHQSESGLTIVNNGMVTFNSKDYANILAKDQVVRAETKIYGRGAGVDLRFDVLKSIETKYPELFTGLTTTADKLTKLLSLIKKAYFVHASRGAGVSFVAETKGQPINAVQSAMILPRGNTAWPLGQNNLTENFLEAGSVLTDSYIPNIQKDGSFIFRISTYRNFVDAPFEGGRGLSDGVTPAWVEVKDARLEVSIQPPEDPNAKPITITVTPS